MSFRAHLVPSCYLAGFGADSINSRTRNLIAIRRDKIHTSTSGKACRHRNYYTDNPELDGALFSEQEGYLSTLVSSIENGDESWKSDASRHIWLLKVRTRSILEGSVYRIPMIEAARTGGGFIGGDAVSLTVRPEANDLVTSDSPVITVSSGTGWPEGRTGYLKEIDAMILPITPRRLVVVLNRYSDVVCEGELTDSDVNVLNSWQAKQAIENLIAMRRPSNINELQAAMSGPTSFPSDVVPTYPGGSAALFNFHSMSLHVFRQLGFTR